MMYWKKRACSLLLLASVLLVGFGCGTHEEPAMDQKSLESEMVGKVWILKNLFAREIRSDKPLTLKFNADGMVEGFGGCNSFTGKYTLTGDSLSFGPLATTRKACGPALGEQEYTFLTYLAKISKALIDDDELQLFSEGENVPIVLTTDEGGLFW